MAADRKMKADPEGSTTMHKYSITEERILTRLKKGPATREELAKITGDDRKLRRVIATLQAKDPGDGRLIINLQDRSGYKIAESNAELLRYKTQEFARATKTLEKLSNMTWQKDRQIAIN